MGSSAWRCTCRARKTSSTLVDGRRARHLPRRLSPERGRAVGYNFEQADVELLFHHFDDYEAEAKRLVDAQLRAARVREVLKASHTFNLLDARGAISVTERQRTSAGCERSPAASPRRTTSRASAWAFPWQPNERSRCSSSSSPRSYRPSRCAPSRRPLPRTCSPRWPRPVSPRPTPSMTVYATPRRLAFSIARVAASAPAAKARSPVPRQARPSRRSPASRASTASRSPSWVGAIRRRVRS